MPPRRVPRARDPRRAAQRHIHLVVERARPAQQLPVQRAGGQVEGARVDEGERAAPRRDRRQLREAHVVADGDGDGAVARQLDQRHLVARRQHRALAERDLARDVDVEEVRLAVRAEQRAVGAEDERRVVEAVAVPGLGGGVGRVRLRDRAAHQVDAGVSGDGGEGVEGRGLRRGGGRREERLGVGGEEFAAVGRVEAFGEDDDFRARLGGGEGLGACICEVEGFVGAWETRVSTGAGRDGVGIWRGADRWPAAPGRASRAA